MEIRDYNGSGDWSADAVRERYRLHCSRLGLWPLRRGVAGQVVDLPEWRAVGTTTIAVGQPARIAIVKPAAESGKVVVEAVLR